MTIAAAYLTSEGVVLGADSTTTVSLQTPQGASGVAQLFNHAQKVFEIGQGSNLGLCTWGAGTVGTTSHRTIAVRLAEKLKASPQRSVADAANMLVALVEEAFAAGGPVRSDVGYYVGGWNEADHLPACFRVLVPANGTPVSHPLGIGEASFSGAPRFFSRIFHGYDRELPDLLLKVLTTKVPGLPPDFGARFAEAFREASAPLVATGFPDLPIREAIDYVHAYLHVTVKVFKFQFGPPVCGGPIEVAFISSDRRFRWVCHKPFDSAIREEEADCNE